MTIRRGAWGLLFALLVSRALYGAVDPYSALLEGNRRFRSGDLEGAMRAYVEGYRISAPDPALAYNLGVTAHRLERLPEAVLWYRRAAILERDDPWLAHNLEIARGSLPAPERAAPPWASWIERRRQVLLAGIALAWAVPLLLLAPPSGLRRWGLVTAAVLSCLAFAAGSLAGRVGPRAAVLLEDCAGTGGELAAGSEVWVLRDGEVWRVLSAPEAPACPARAVGLVEP
ncbi:MAG TPA: hypothetical protein VMW27_28525 [Thermoanaerobaculia bacterium]|nr:hypothetical protein [Thermoanaerobaculia bacterium]